MKSTRRTFLKSSLLTAASLSISVRSWAQVAGANDSIRVGVIGLNGRGGDHISGMTGLAGKGVKITAFCDCDSKILQGRADGFDKKSGGTVKRYTDLRKMMEDKEIDVVTVATPNHWHSLAAIWAVQAGKDVYLEKPVSHNVWEGRRVVEAARHYGKIVQTGTQSRSSQAILQSIEWVRAGNLGKILRARGLCFKPRGSIGRVEAEQKVPESIDYDLWCGPAPMDPLKRTRLHYDWHWIWAYGNGDLGNQGIHQMDIARWFLGEQELSPAVVSVGGRLGYQDDGETPNTQIVFHDYKPAPLIFEVRGLRSRKGGAEMDKYPMQNGGSVAVIIECEGGHVLVPDYTSAFAFDKNQQLVKDWKGTSDHYANFIAAVRSRKHTDLKADILEGHLSSALCHTGNISYRLGSKVTAEEAREKLQDQKDGEATMGRMIDHLAANEVDLQGKELTLGAFLKMNPKTERFKSNKKADQLLTREYRSSFQVPTKFT